MNSLILGLAGVMVVFTILGIYLLIEENKNNGQK
jgi:hypothetical protein